MAAEIEPTFEFAASESEAGALNAWLAALKPQLAPLPINTEVTSPCCDPGSCS